MSDQYTITGTINSQNGAERAGIKVQAFDRDLPSVERRRDGVLVMLGEDTTDGKGHFQINYTLEQFSSGEGTSLFGNSHGTNADLSFRVFDRTGRELSIRSISTLHQEFGPDHIIFNAPTSIEVSILMEAPREAGASEFERLIAFIAPVVEDVPLVELSDEDVVFLIDESDLEKETDFQHRIEWLRRCALLAQEADLPIEAFYGWGRKDVPATLAELAAVAVKDLPRVLEKLTGLPAEDLRAALSAAIVDRIIPASFRTRVDEIVLQLTRRGQVLRAVVAQLQDQETQAPLAGYSVTTFDTGAGDESRGLDITDDDGKFQFDFYVPRAIPAGAAPREFRLEVLAPNGERLPQDGHISVDLQQAQADALPAPVRVPRPEIADRQAQFKSIVLDAPPDLRAFLSDQLNIQTLADIRRHGGLGHLADLPKSDPAMIQRLESLADLDRISPDVTVSQALLQRKFDSVLAIADTPHAEFVAQVSNGDGVLKEVDASRLHVAASAQTRLLDNMLAGMAVNHANGFQLLEAEGAAPAAAALFQPTCGCADCQAAVSPAAYLTTLLDYALKHIRKDGQDKIDLPFLVDTFHQPFSDLPTDCEAAEKPVRQARICIEALRSYLGKRPLANAATEAALAKGEADYGFAVYTFLLARLGTSYEEIRRSHAETAENRRALAARLGIDLTEPRPADVPGDEEHNGDELDQLFLDPGAQPPADHLLAAQAIEKLFGLGDTARDPLSEGARLGDDQGQISRWNLQGVTWNQNTDPDGRVYVTLLNPAADVFRLELYRDPGRGQLVASGEIAAASGTVKLLPENHSGLSGVFEIAFTADSTTITIAAIPTVLAWRLRHLRTLWSSQDHPSDAYGEDAAPGDEASLRLPIIDPDLIGPDDFRAPVKANPADPDRAFDIWLKRRASLDKILGGLQRDRETQGLTVILRQVLGNPLPDLDGLQSALTKGGTAKEIQAARDSVAVLGLSVESFTRLMSLRAKDQLASSNAHAEAVGEAEWREVYAILAQALKVRRFAAWRTEEKGAGVRLGLEEFWVSVREPQEGDWPPLQAPGQPLIDPDIVKLTDLPEWLAGKEALALWNARRTFVDHIPAQLQRAHDTGDFNRMLRRALGHPAPGDALQHDLNVLKDDLGSPDERIRSKAADQVETDLHLTVESFNRLMVIKAANDQPDPAKKPAAAELAEVYAMLAPADKIKHAYPQWIQEENDAGLVYWQVLKARLPRWRASAEYRQAWQQALRVRSRPPIIDPSVMGADDLQHVIPGDPAFDIWKARYDHITAVHDGLRAAREAAPDNLTGLGNVVHDALGFELADLEALDLERQAGHSIERRLEQLNLGSGAFAYLLRVRGLAEAVQPITDAEWETAYDTLTYTRVRREFAAFRAEEQDRQIILAPDFFKIPKALATPLPFVAPFTPPWLSTRQARGDWQDMLQARIDQEDAVAQGFQSAISGVEEVALPALRDALILASDAAGANLGEQAESITARLLIDARAAGCPVTTRVEQALETLQTLILDLRTGQFRQLPTFTLSLVSDYFDEEWKWLGSYATFRAPTFVFLYPENILQPGLLKYQTPAFRKLIADTRGLRLTPAKACQMADEYAAYFRDICSLEIEATCQASTRMSVGEGCDAQAAKSESMFYLFGRAPSGKIYWSAYDAGDNSSGYGQTFWQEVPGFSEAKVARIVGAMPYRKTAPQGGSLSATGSGDVVLSAYIYLFCIAGEADKPALKLAKLSLDRFGDWDSAGSAIDLPLAPVSVSALEIVPVQTQSEFVPPGLVIRTRNDKLKLYYRQLDRDGVNWEPTNPDWTSYSFQIPPFAVIDNIEAAVLAITDTLWLVFSDRRRSSFTLQLFGLSRADKRLYGTGKAFKGTGFLGALPVPGAASFSTVSQPKKIFIFYRDSSGSHYIHFSSDAEDGPVADALSDLVRIAPHSGSAPAGRQMLAYKRQKIGQVFFYMYRYAESGDSLVASATIRAVPRVEAPLDIPLHLSAATLQQRRQDIVKAFTLLNADATDGLLSYLREAYYFVPLHLALALQSAGHHLAALDGLRTIYDYEAPISPQNQRNIYYGLELDAGLPETPLYQQADGWLRDPLNPHLIAATRRYAYTRSTLMTLVRCMLDFADAEFTQDTGESLANARTLYLTALDLLNLPELQQKLGSCDDLIGALKIEPGQDVPPEVPAAVAAIMDDLTKAAAAQGNGRVTAIPKNAQIATVVKDVAVKLKGASEWTVKLAEAREIVQAAAAKTPLPLGTGATMSATASLVKQQHALLMTAPNVDDRLQAVSQDVVTKVFDGVGLMRPAAHPDNGKVQPAAPPPLAVAPVLAPGLQFCIPPNPILKALRLRAELNLHKLRTCRNIAGLLRQVDAYAAPTDTTSGMPAIGAGGQLVLPGIATLRPSLYRYPVLIERAKQLVQFAAQIEAAMLSAIERRDGEAETLLRARQQVSLARSGVRLEDLRVVEANDGVTLAGLQQDRAQIQIDTYAAWLETGANQYENDMVFAYRLVALSQKAAADASNQIQAKQAAIFSAQLAAQIAQAGTPAAVVGGIGAGLLNLGVDLTLFDNLRDATRDATNFTLDAQIASINAALERRKDEWRLAQSLAEQDFLIGGEQKAIANDHVQVVTQERVIAGIGADNARDTVEFLTNKFTNVELFDWMGNVLEGVYSFFLQQATAMAKLAENQLAFERQEVPPAMINADYWEMPSDSALGNADGKGPDRRGLTGSARLLQDIFQLDQYAFNTNKRKLPLTKTISLARLVPVEFQRFRETGVLPFATPMEMFDRGFPGHYLRLIKRVRASVIALVPSTQGIYATLSTTGPSRVVIGGDMFQTVPIRRNPEFIALSAPSFSTGVFELDVQPDMLLPFEGSGVEMSWEFNMPKAANQFDYRTIADVLITLEYTALFSPDYRQQVIQSLRPTISADRPFSFRNQFPDQWYDLHNSEETSTPMTVRFITRPEDFPPNIEALRIDHVLLYFVGADATSREVPVSRLAYTAQQEAGPVGGSATSIDGVISTRRGNAGSWTAMIGKSPAGEWELALPNTAEIKDRFKNEEIGDILLVLTYSGRTPVWPN